MHITLPFIKDERNSHTNDMDMLVFYIKNKTVPEDLIPQGDNFNAFRICPIF